jgi:hypothetical protein
MALQAMRRTEIQYVSEGFNGGQAFAYLAVFPYERRIICVLINI